jgi:hypothetical protein
MAAVYGMLRHGQQSAMREPEISALQQSARGALSMVDQDLTMAGYQVPAVMSIFCLDGGGDRPDEITIWYGESDFPTSRMNVCRRGQPCEMVHSSSTLSINPNTFDPALYDAVDAEEVYHVGMTLVAYERSDCNKDGKFGFYPFKVVSTPRLGIEARLPALTLRHEPARLDPMLYIPEGFSSEIHPNCANIGRFRIVQYRIHPLPPTPHPNLERRDLSTGEPWTPVASNIENLQLEYATGASEDLSATPPPPLPLDPLTWITRVKVTVSARSASANIQGGTPGAYSEEGEHVRKSFTTTISLRNQIAQIQKESQYRTYN